MTSVIALTIEFGLLFLFKLGGYIIPDYTYSLMIFLFSFAFMFDLAKSKTLAYARGALFFGYLWRIFLVYWDIYYWHIFLLPNSGGDSWVFYNCAVAFVRTGDPGRAELFGRVMGTIFKAVGTSKLYGQFLITLLSVLALCLFARMLNMLGLNRRVKRWTILLFSLLPNFAILSSIFLREAPVCLLLTLSVYCFYIWFDTNRMSALVLAFVCSFAAAAFHSGSIAACVGYVIVYLLYDRRKKEFRANPNSIVPAIALALVLIFLLLNYSDTFLGNMGNVDSIEDIAKTDDSGGSSYAQYVGNSATPLNMLIYTIPRIVYFLFSPFPWQWRGVGDIIAFLFSSLVNLIAILRSIRYLRDDEGEHKQILIALLIVAAAIAFVFAWGVSNTGTAARHRDKMVLIFGLIYAISLNPKRAPHLIVIRQ